MRNIRVVLLGELVLIIVVFLFLILTGFGVSSILWFVDVPSLLIILFVLVPGLFIMGEWQDFVRSFSVGIRKFSLLELKNIIGAVD